MNTIDLADAANVVLPLAASAVAAALPALVVMLKRAITKHLAITLDDAATNKVLAACEAGAGEMYRVALQHTDGLKSVAVQNASLAAGVNHVLSTVPAALNLLGITPDAVGRMVSARFGAILASDPTVTAGIPVAVAPPATIGGAAPVATEQPAVVAA